MMCPCISPVNHPVKVCIVVKDMSWDERLSSGIWTLVTVLYPNFILQHKTHPKLDAWGQVFDN